jgi:hypothetical protein
MRRWFGISFALAITLVAAAGCEAPSRVLFPTAAKVRVYGAPYPLVIKIDKAGHLSSSSSSQNSGKILDGGWLEKQEIFQLRTSISFNKWPGHVASCCYPRHAFLFYDESGQYLGHLTICFQCGCANMSPFKQGRDGKNWIDWRRDLVARIVLAHNLGPLKTEREN